MARNKQLTLISIVYEGLFNEKFISKGLTKNIFSSMESCSVSKYLDSYAFEVGESMLDSKAVEEANFTYIKIEIDVNFEGVSVEYINQGKSTSRTHYYNKNLALDIFNYIVEEDIYSFSSDPVPIVLKKLTKFSFIGR